MKPQPMRLVDDFLIELSTDAASAVAGINGECGSGGIFVSAPVGPARKRRPTAYIG
jgi:hypothetical protein